ncbi:sulfurtransferase complex subunit TusB [Hydrogenophilus thiooxidans]|uniref:sulfurtransferase complex subunit TusB n=1 Tax=Hydrogenophilus thiooxidans TaxID=2820326 RepID=UPI001C2101BC|nr:sulfurtransferase complex subunit TusB [Hydrogenophilus thiooxidans]
MLHIINKSPFDRPTLDTVLRVAQGGAALLIEDAVVAATRGCIAANKVVELAKKMPVYVLGPDLEARGLADRVIEGVQVVGYDGFVNLVAEHRNCQSWL